MALAETANLAVRLSLDDKFSKGIGGATRSLGKFESSVGRIGRGAGQLSSGLARAGTIVGVGLGTALVGATKAAIDYESAFQGVVKTVEASPEQLAELSDEFRQLAREIPIAATEFARLGETAGALGVNVDAIDEFVEVTAKLGVTTDLTADAAADALGRIGNIVGLTADEYDNFGSALVNLGNKGASTEAEIIEITKRFAAAGKQAGLMTPEILGFAEAVASFTGLNPEAAGSSLSRFVGTLTKVAAGGGKKFELLNKIVGEDFRKALDKDASGAMLKFLKGLKKLDKYERANALKALGLDSVYLRQLITGLTDNIGDVETSLDNADEGWRGNFLNKEAATRFDTLASKLQVFKNNIIDAGITIGTAMLPSIERATEKLTKFLQAPGNQEELKALGEDIGDAIDGIDWDQVVKGAKSLVSVMKVAFDWAKRLFDLFNALPTEIKGAAAGFLALNKLSGGLVAGGLGNILGGLGGGVAGRLPGVGKLFAQPVFVTNWPMGGLGGGGIGGGGKGGGIRGFVGGAGGLLAAGVAAGLAVEAVGIWQDTNARSTEQAQTAQDNLSAMLAQKPTLESLLTSQQAVKDGITAITSNPLLTLVQGEALDKLRSMDAELSKEITERRGGAVDRRGPETPGVITPPGGARDRPGASLKPVVSTLGQQKAELGNIKNGLATLRTNAASQSAAQKAELGNIKNTISTQTAMQRAQLVANLAATVVGNVQATIAAASAALRDAAQTGAIRTGAAQTSSASRSAGQTVAGSMAIAASRIVGAVNALDLSVNVTTVNRTSTVNNRYGPSGGSSTTNRSGELE